MFILMCSVSVFAGTVVGDQKVCTSGANNLKNYYCKLFENTNVGTNILLLTSPASFS